MAVVSVGCGRVGFDASERPDGDGGANVDAPTTILCGSRTATFVPETGVIEGRFELLTDDAEGSCGGAGANDALFVIDVAEGAALHAAADGNHDARTRVHIRTTCDRPDTEIACDTNGGVNDNGQWRTGPLAEGRYWVFVDEVLPSADVFGGTIQTLLPSGSPCSISNARDRCGPGLECRGGACAVATCAPVEDLGSVPIDEVVVTSGQLNRFAGARSCSEGSDAGARSPEVIGRFVLAAPVANLHVTTAYPETTFDTVVYLREGSCHGTELVCNDDFSSTVETTFDTGALAAGTYFVFIDGFGAKHGSARITID